jgi:serine/threonine protein kinase
MPVCPKCHEENPKLGAKCPRDGFYFIEEGALDEAEEDSRIGQLTADKFVIVDLISEGGMGAVYKAIQLPVEREVAVKVLRAELEDSDQGRDRFIREARAVSKLTHPNVITLHDFGFEDSGHPYMVMEYAPGVSLAAWLRRADVTVSRIVHVLKQVLSALSDAHKRGIVHRDLKPENLIVTKTGNDEDYIKLLDFGIARLVNEGATRGLTREGEVFGTPHYMSPEQAQGSTDIGPPADVYALGIIAYELFAGSPPFDASTPLSVLYMHINDDLPTLRPRGGLEPPDAVMHVIRTATQKDPQERYQTAGEMLDDLNKRLEDKDISSSVPSSAGASQSGQFPERASSKKAPAAKRESSGETVILDEPAESPSDADANPGSNTAPTWANTPPTAGMDTQQSLTGARKRRIILVAVGLLAFVVSIGFASAFLFGGDDNGQEKPEAEAVEEAAPPATDSPIEPTVTDEPGDDESESPGNRAGTASEEQAPEASPPADEGVDEGEAKAAERENAEREVELDDSDQDSAPAPNKSSSEQAKKPEPGADRASKARDERSENDDGEPEKFEPAKFKPAKTSDDDPDDDPDKFEPAKWR